MPHQRFNKLPVEKRAQIMQTAGKEFAMYGFENASLNRILEVVGMSKGAAYYYFDDKADLFAAVLTHYAPVMVNITSVNNINADDLTSETFWPSIITIYSTPSERIHDSPWLMGLFRALNHLASPTRDQEAIKLFIDQLWFWFLALVKRGQMLGVVRTDLSDELLFELVAGVDGAGDQWLADQWEKLTPEQAQDILRSVADAIRRIMSP